MTGRFRWGRGVEEHPADRQGRWAEIRRQASELAEGEPGTAVIHPYVAISREAGAGGVEVARDVGGALGWHVLDREILDAIAEESRLDANMVALLDETSLSWFSESVLNLVHSRLIGQNTYVERLVKLLLVSLAREPAVVVGRGASAFLPRERGVSVRLVADPEYRIGLIERRRGVGEAEARRWIDETDSDRHAFVRRHFNQDPADPLSYDLTINTRRTGLEGAANLIVGAVRERGLHDAVMTAP